MSQYARINTLTMKVDNVIVADAEHIASLPDYDRWIETASAGIGFTYDAQRDAFIPPKPFASWVLNEESHLWEPPVPHPNDGQYYHWDESAQQWILISQEGEV